MADEIVIESRLSPARLPCREGEEVVKLMLSVRPSEAFRASLSQEPTVASGGVDICLVIDVSHTMCIVIGDDFKRTGRFIDVEGVQLEQVEGGTTKLKACVDAARPLLGLLRPDDTLSLVTFGDEARLLAERLGPGRSAEYQAALESLTASGLTALGQGIQTATGVLARGLPDRSKSIILMTDGNPQGEDPQVAQAAGEAAAKQGVTVNCLGFGADFNFGKMQEIVTPSLGRSSLLHTQADVETLFSDLLRKAQAVVVNNLRLRLRFSDQVRVTDHYRGAPENLYLGKVRTNSASRDCLLSLGSVERDQRYDYYFLLTVPTQKDLQEEIRILKAELTYDIPAREVREASVTRNVLINFVADPREASLRDSLVESGFAAAEIKRLEQERDGYLANGDQVMVLQRFRDIIQRCDQLGDVLKKKDVQDALDEYTRTGKISQDLLNRGASSSSKPADSGELSKRLPREQTEANTGQVPRWKSSSPSGPSRRGDS